MRHSPKRSIYLLSMWQERSASPDHPAVWRYGLENVRTGQKHGFGNLDELVIFFKQRMAVQEQLDRRTTR